MIKRIAFIFFTFFCLISCVSFRNVVKPSSNDILNGWIGKNVNDVYFSWGIPTRKQTTQNMLLLEYDYHEQETTESYTTGGYWVGNGRNRSYVLPTYHPEVTKDFFCQITFVIQNETVSKYILSGQPNVIDKNIKEPTGFTDQFYEKQFQNISKTWQNKDFKFVIKTFGKNFSTETENNQEKIVYTKSYKHKNTIYSCDIIFTTKNNIVTSIEYNGDLQAKCKFIVPCLK